MYLIIIILIILMKFLVFVSFLPSLLKELFQFLPDSFSKIIIAKLRPWTFWLSSKIMTIEVN